MRHEYDAATFRAVEQAWREHDQIRRILDDAGVPTRSYEAQGGGVCAWTLAGRVDHLIRLLQRHDISLSEGVWESQEAMRAAFEERD